MKSQIGLMIKKMIKRLMEIIKEYILATKHKNNTIRRQEHIFNIIYYFQCLKLLGKKEILSIRNWV